MTMPLDPLLQFVRIFSGVADLVMIGDSYIFGSSHFSVDLKFSFITLLVTPFLKTTNISAEEPDGSFKIVT